jgi:sugar lactone lactonase YvrE
MLDLCADFRTPVALALVIALCESCAAHPSDHPSAASADTSGGVQPSGARLVAGLVALHGPESARYDPDQDVFFISNMYGYGSAKDDNGYIVRASAADLSRADVFVQGGRNGVTLNAPKGLAIHGDTLWVADIDELRGFDRRSGAPLATIDFRPQSAVLLNDVAVGPNGELRVTDSGIVMSDKGVLHPGGDRIFVVGHNHSISVAAVGEELDRPNGITWDAHANRWLVVSFDPFASQLYAMRENDSTRVVLASGKGRFDGVEVLGTDTILFSCWNDSSIHLLAGTRDRQIVRNLPQPADIGLDTRRHRVAIPVAALDRVELWALPATESPQP